MIQQKNVLFVPAFKHYIKSTPTLLNNDSKVQVSENNVDIPEQGNTISLEKLDDKKMYYS